MRPKPSLAYHPDRPEIAAAIASLRRLEAIAEDVADRAARIGALNEGHTLTFDDTLALGSAAGMLEGFAADLQKRIAAIRNREAHS